MYVRGVCEGRVFQRSRFSAISSRVGTSIDLFRYYFVANVYGVCLVVGKGLSSGGRVFGLFFRFYGTFFFFYEGQGCEVSYFFFRSFQLSFQLGVDFVVRSGHLFSDGRFRSFFVVFIGQGEEVRCMGGRVYFLYRFSNSICPCFFRGVLYFPSSNYVGGLRECSVGYSVFLRGISNHSYGVYRGDPIFSSRGVWR